MLRVFAQIERAARTDATVLITGESGTGKELAAAEIHRGGARRDARYSVVNIAAVPESLIESELFGHVKGSFTNAIADREGCFEAADGGTLFLDEIGDLAPTTQIKLLRVLENHEVTPVGSNEVRHVDVRVIAATSRPLSAMVADKSFREDLFYRLNVVAIDLPPLRKRDGDVPLLIEHCLRELTECYGRHPPELSEDLKQFLNEYDWPGNVRQLRNCIESMVVLADSHRLTLDALPAMVRRFAPANNSAHPIEIPDNVTLEDLEKAAILQSLQRCDGNRTQAAASLGISVRTLQRKLKLWCTPSPAAANYRGNGDATSVQPTRRRRRALAPV